MLRAPAVLGSNDGILSTSSLVLGVYGPRMRLMAATGILGPADASGSRRQRSTSNRHENDVKKMQQTLRDKAHYRGEVDSSEER